MVVGVSRVGKDRFGAPWQTAFTPRAGGAAPLDHGRTVDERLASDFHHS